MSEDKEATTNKRPASGGRVTDFEPSADKKQKNSRVVYGNGRVQDILYELSSRSGLFNDLSDLIAGYDSDWDFSWVNVETAPCVFPLNAVDTLDEEHPSMSRLLKHADWFAFDRGDYVIESRLISFRTGETCLEASVMGPLSRSLFESRLSNHAADAYAQLEEEHKTQPRMVYDFDIRGCSNRFDERLRNWFEAFVLDDSKYKGHGGTPVFKTVGKPFTGDQHELEYPHLKTGIPLEYNWGSWAVRKRSMRTCKRFEPPDLSILYAREPDEKNEKELRQLLAVHHSEGADWLKREFGFFRMMNSELAKDFSNEPNGYHTMMIVHAVNAPVGCYAVLKRTGAMKLTDLMRIRLFASNRVFRALANSEEAENVHYVFIAVMFGDGLSQRLVCYYTTADDINKAKKEKKRAPFKLAGVGLAKLNTF